MNAKQLRTELETLTNRREQLAAELETTNASLATAREGLVMVSGGPKALDATTAATSRATAIREAINALDVSIEAKRVELVAAEASEASQAKAARMAAITSEREAAANDFWAARLKVNELLSVHVEAIREARNRWHQLTAEGNELGGRFGDRMANRPAEAPFVEAINSAIGAADRVAERRQSFERSQALAARRRKMGVAA